MAKEYGDGSGPKPASEYGPPSAHYYRNKAAAEEAAKREDAKRAKAIKDLAAKLKAAGAAYAARFNRSAK